LSVNLAKLAPALRYSHFMTQNSFNPTSLMLANFSPPQKVNFDIKANQKLI